LVEAWLEVFAEVCSKVSPVKMKEEVYQKIKTLLEFKQPVITRKNGAWMLSKIAVVCNTHIQYKELIFLGLG
jgi:hypothetical protein